MNPLEILSAVSLINKDNGKRFTKTLRLDKITSLLCNTEYRRVNADGLFHLYATKPIHYFSGNNVIVVSSHVDCEENITACFSEEQKDGMLIGTFDNAITNAATLALMMEGALPDNILIAFTGDEEREQHGARDLYCFLSDNRISIAQVFVLDVTDMGWEQQVDFTVENNFWNNALGKRIIEIVCGLPYAWRFVPSDPDNVPSFVPMQQVISVEAEEDESWYYDEEGIDCCSICLPVYGEMHSNKGVLARKDGFVQYVAALRSILQRTADYL